MSIPRTGFVTLAYRGADGNIYILSRPEGDTVWTLERPSLLASADPLRPIGYRVVGYRGDDGRLHELRNTGVPGEWTPRLATLTPWNP